MQFKKIILEGGLLPRGYGVAWRYPGHCFNVVCYPIPFNLIVRAFKDFYYWLMRGCWRSRYEADLMKAHMEGYRQFRENYENRLLALKGMEKMQQALTTKGE